MKCHLISKKVIDIAINYQYLFTKLTLLTIALTIVNGEFKDAEAKDTLTQNNSNNSCLDSLVVNEPKKALPTCNTIINKFPNSPKLLNERSIIYSLLGENELACLDIFKAMNLLQEFSSDKLDPLIKYQIEVRHTSCRKR